MLATFIIGLREGLEAALIVSIIATFLRRNGQSLRPMWIGVGAAIALSIAVGVLLSVIEQSLPQAQQEGMEAVIGTVAVVFVTGMILWMRRNARGLKRELESEAAAALSHGAGRALAAMAFLAVLKEGFETSVFLLATFQAASSATTAAAGAVAGIVCAAALGYGIFAGGVRLNLARFFTWTGVFLVLVAAGLVVTVLRTAHEAGWITIGQQRTADLGWLAPNGSVRGALVTGVLGIPADPRVIEVLGWLCYLVPVLAISLWPQNRVPAPRTVPRIRIGIAAALVVTAVVLAVAVPSGAPDLPGSAPTRGSVDTATLTLDGSTAQVRTRNASTVAVIRFSASDRRTVTHRGVGADRWRTVSRPSSDGRPATITLDQLTALFGRVPVGISPAQNPGPYRASWSLKRTVTAWSAGGGLLDARQYDEVVLVLSGGGLTGSRVLTRDTATWSVVAATAARRAIEVADAVTVASERRLWRRWLPLALLVAAITQAALAVRDRRRLSPSSESSDDSSDPTARSPLNVVS